MKVIDRKDLICEADLDEDDLELDDAEMDTRASLEDYEDLISFSKDDFNEL